MIVATLIATAVLLSHEDAVLTASDSRWTALFLGNFHFASATPNIAVVRFAPLQQLWSLAVEEQFYLFYPALFALLLIGHRKPAYRRRLVLGLTAIILISFVLAVVSFKTGETGPYVSPFNRAWEFAAGALVAAGATQLKRLPGGLASALTWAGAFCILFTATTFPLSPPAYDRASCFWCCACHSWWDEHSSLGSRVSIAATAAPMDWSFVLFMVLMALANPCNSD